MDQKERSLRPANPKQTANFLSLITFFYTAKTFYKGFKKDLEEEDIFEILRKLKSSARGDELELKWKQLKVHSKNPTVFKALWTCYGWRWLAYGSIEMVVRTSTGIIVPFSTGKIVQYFIPGQDMTKNLAIMYALIVISTKIFDSIIYHNNFLLLNELCTVVRTACCSLIYRKSLKLSPSSMTEHNTGSIVTLMTKDVQYIDSFMQYGNEFWIALVSPVIITSLLYVKIGFAAVVGIGVLFVVVPLEVYLGKKAGIRRMETCKKTDARLQETQEIISCIKILKMYTWEVLFADRVSAARKQEIIKLRHVFYMKALSFCVGFVCSNISFYTLLVLYNNSGEVTAENLYFMIGAFEYMKFSIAIGMPHSITAFAEMMAALKRIQNLLEAGELPTQKPENLDEKPKITFYNVSFSVEEKTILSNISCTISSGLNAITGPVASGKSSLLKVALQEYPADSGDLEICGTISYASQEPWLFPATIRENILFGAQYDEKKYQNILDVCALKYDLALLANGDATIVEDGGSNLSKGQQIRVNLARAIYRDCDIYLLDDCLASLDTRVKEHIFQFCIKDYLHGKIVLFVTHDIKLVENSDQIILMTDGAIKSIKKPCEIPQEELLKYIEHTQNIGNVGSKQDIKIEEEQSTYYQDSREIEDNEHSKLTENISTKTENIYREHKKVGSVGFGIYMRYFKFGGGLWLVFFVFGLYGADQFCASFLDKTVTNWVNAREEVANLTRNNATNTTLFFEKTEQVHFLWSMYSVLIIAASTSVLIKSFVYYIFISKVSINIHRAMVSNVVSAKMAFFDSTFIGNILNRFSRDLATIDEQLPFIIDECLHISLIALAVFGLVSSVNPYFLISAAGTLIIIMIVAKIYSPTGRSLKRLDSATRSPMVGHINSTLEGLTTIRAFKNQQIVQAEFDRHQDLFTSAYHMSLVTTRAFAIVIDVFSTSFIISVITNFLIYENALPGSVGLALTQAAKLTGVLQWGIFQWAGLENQMTSVERVLEYTDVKSENKSGLEPKFWPKEGSIVYESVSLTYEKTKETVLKNINLNIPARSKIGIVGRTGAGKSSIISTLFRLYDVQGRILIDGVDIKTIALEYLRSNISIIPQDPLLFKGTVRYNIDPEGVYRDEDIWTVLERVGLRDVVSDLDMEFGHADCQISAGQKQLLCLARALVRDSKIVVLDEATASLDPEIDELINQIICEHFHDRTVLTIAHKLDSIMHVDKVLVLEKGEIAEFDSPNVLLDDKTSIFSKMVGQKI